MSKINQGGEKDRINLERVKITESYPFKPQNDERMNSSDVLSHMEQSCNNRNIEFDRTKMESVIKKEIEIDKKEFYKKAGESRVHYEKYKDFGGRWDMFVDDKPIYEIGEQIEKNKFIDFRNKFENIILKTSDSPFLHCSDKQSVYECHLFGKGEIIKLLSQPDCHGIRVYYGIDENDKPSLMLVGVYKDGQNMTGHSIIEDRAEICPDICPEN